MNKPILAAYCAHGGINAVSNATLEKLDIVYYAFGAINGTEIEFNYAEDLKRVEQIKTEHPTLKVLLSIGGGGCASLMTQAVKTEEGFQKIINNIVAAMIDYDFDGIDLDWEFPTTTGHPEELQKHTEMLRIIRSKLDLLERKYYLSIAVPDGIWAFKITELEKSEKYLDYINVMTYDMTDFNFTSHHTAPYASNHESFREGRSTYDSICIFKEKGIPQEKIIIGAAFYSKKWTNIVGGINGLSAQADSAVEYGPGISNLQQDYINKNGFKRYWDSGACAPYLYDGNTFITYDDLDSIKCKCSMVISEKIGGIMIWELCGDRKQNILPYMRNLLNAQA